MIGLLRHETVTVNRKATSYDANGRPQVGSTTVIAGVNANIQPLRGDEILQLPEGDRDLKTYWCFTDIELKGNDEVIRDGEKFEVHPVEDWSRAGFLVHYKSRIVSKERQ